MIMQISEGDLVQSLISASQKYHNFQMIILNSFTQALRFNHQTAVTTRFYHPKAVTTESR